MQGRGPTGVYISEVVRRSALFEHLIPPESLSFLQSLAAVYSCNRVRLASIAPLEYARLTYGGEVLSQTKTVEDPGL
jgi:hypothetical protein